MVNQLIAKAKAGATALPIREKDVSGLAEHFRMASREPLRKETCERMIRDGLSSIYGVRVVVSDGE